jgi:hypothetical protein
MYSIGISCIGLLSHITYLANTCEFAINVTSILRLPFCPLVMLFSIVSEGMNSIVKVLKSKKTNYQFQVYKKFPEFLSFLFSN